MRRAITSHDIEVAVNSAFVSADEIKAWNGDPERVKKLAWLPAMATILIHIAVDA